MWDVTLYGRSRLMSDINFYSHIPCGMWHGEFQKLDIDVISTHTSRVGCDKLTLICSQTMLISTHTSRVGCDARLIAVFPHLSAFLLTHPVWDVTHNKILNLKRVHNFYSHIPCGMWRIVYLNQMWIQLFLLTHPVWDVTHLLYLDTFVVGISTHTSRVGCDPQLLYQ